MRKILFGAVAALEIHALGAKVVAITASQSPLAKKADVTLIVDHIEDIATHLPMVSRILHLLVIDILAVGVDEAEQLQHTRWSHLQALELERQEGCENVVVVATVHALGRDVGEEIRTVAELRPLAGEEGGVSGEGGPPPRPQRVAGIHDLLGEEIPVEGVRQ